MADAEANRAMSGAAAAPELSLARGRMARSLIALFLLTAFADDLFYGQNLGASVGVFVLSTGIAAGFCRPRGGGWPAAIMLAAAAPSLTGAGPLALGIALFGTAYATAGADMGAAFVLLRGAFWRLVPDLLRASLYAPPFLRRIYHPAALVVWVVPVGLSAVFLSLFASANPLIETGLSAFSPLDLLAGLSFVRAVFWALIAGLVWPFVAPRVVVARARMVKAGRGQSKAAGLLFGKAAILRALILFNMIFAVQTVLDVYYLWFGAKLPDGLTYADYAHRGAYPLIATALLAGVFAILATKPGSEAAASRLVRALVLAWIAQNVMLVASSMLRLKLYVDVYALTEMRLAALIWMLLVAAGLLLIIARIALARSNKWLIQWNAGILAAVLYGCAFVNFPGFIAGYDVRHCAEYAGAGPPLDFVYIQGLGPQAIPALDMLEKRTDVKPAPGGCIFPQSGAAGQVRQSLAGAFNYDPRDWRGWSFWNWYLAVYLQAHDVKCG